MADLVSDGGEFSCNFCSSKLKLKVSQSSSTGDSQKLANQTNCFFPPPGGNCTFPPGAPPTPCPGIPPGMVSSTGQSTVKVDGQTALGDGCQFVCPKGQPVSLSKAGQAIAKHDEASATPMGFLVAGTAVAMRAPHPIAKIGLEAVVLVSAGVMAVSNLIKNKDTSSRDSASSSSAASSASPPPEDEDPKKSKKKTAKQKNLENKKRDGTPGNNNAQNKSFKGAVKKIEKELGRPLSKPEQRLLHEEITGRNYDFNTIVEEGLNLFK